MLCRLCDELHDCTWWYIDVCNCDVYSVVNVYRDHLKFYVVGINGRRYVYCSECYVIFNECDESAP